MNIGNTLYTSILSAQPGSQTNLNTITSGLDTLVVTQDSSVEAAVQISSDQDLSIYADTVIIRGPLNLPGRNVAIVARIIDSQLDANNNAAQISVAGIAGAAPP